MCLGWPMELGILVLSAALTLPLTLDPLTIMHDCQPVLTFGTTKMVVNAGLQA